VQVLKGQHYLSEVEFGDSLREFVMLRDQEEEFSAGAKFQHKVQVVRLIRD
jgi:hypothetical protein